MILVTEAGYHGIVALSACRTLPVSASTTSSASACATRGVTTASAATRKIQFNEWRGSRRRRCTFPFRSFETRLEKRRSSRSNVRVSSVSGAVALRQAQTYTGLAGQYRGRAIKSWTKSSQIRGCLNRDRAHAGLFGFDSSARAFLHHEL